MADPSQPQVSFMPAATRRPEPPAMNGGPPPERDVPESPAPPAPPVNDEPVLQRAPAMRPAENQPVLMPSDSGLMVDPGTGFKYRPFTIGGLTVRCARVVPADTMLDVVSKQQKLADRNMDELTTEEQLDMLHLIGQMLGGVVWPEDSDALRERLRDPRDPVDIMELSTAVQGLWGLYNEATAVGKGQ